ncbi:MAG: tetratricopeptide repeat protein, partial [Planctomycetota bacterium]
MNSIRIFASAMLLALLCSPATGLSLPTSEIEHDQQELESRLAESDGSQRLEPLTELVELLHKEDLDKTLAYGAEALELLAGFPDELIEAKVRLRLSRIYSTRGDTDKGLGYARTARRLAVEAKDDAVRALANYHIALALWYRAEVDTAVETAELARETQRKLELEKDLADTCVLLGAIHRSRSAYDAAISCHIEALEISRQLENEQGIARSLNNIGLIYWDLGQYVRAEDHLSRALEYYRRIGNTMTTGSVLSNLGLIHIELKQPEKALVLLDEALQLQHELDLPRTEARVLSNLAFAHESLQDSKTALEYHFRALAIREEINDQYGLARTLGSIGEIHLEEERPAEAVEFIERALENAEASDALDEQYTLRRSLVRAYEASGEHQNASKSAIGLLEFSEEHYDPEIAIRVAEIEAKTKLRDQTKTIETLNSDLSAEQISTRRRESGQRLLIYAVLSLLGIAIAIIFAGKRRSRHATQKNEKQLAHTVQKLRQSERRFHRVFDDSVIPKFLIDVRTRKVLKANQPAQRLCAAGSYEAGSNEADGSEAGCNIPEDA